MNKFNWILTILYLIGGSQVYGQDSLIIKDALSSIGLNTNQIKHEFVSVKPHFNIADEFILVLPEIIEEDEVIFELNTNIIVFNNSNKQIKYKCNEILTSDAITLRDIIIDERPYRIGHETQAIGIKVKYHGQSKVNPYEMETFSLFRTDIDSLICVLDKFELTSNIGVFDTRCEGEYTNIKHEFIEINEQDEAFYPIEVKQEKIIMNDFIDSNGDCVSKDEIFTKRFRLVYKDGYYTEER